MPLINESKPTKVTIWANTPQQAAHFENCKPYLQAKFAETLAQTAVLTDIELVIIDVQATLIELQQARSNTLKYYNEFEV
jgi:hypothetical protein